MNFTTQSHILKTLRLLKTLWEKRKMFVTSSFSFSYNIFHLVKNKFLFLSFNSFVICKCFQCFTSVKCCLLRSQTLSLNFIIPSSHNYTPTRRIFSWYTGINLSVCLSIGIFVCLCSKCYTEPQKKGHTK